MLFQNSKPYFIGEAYIFDDQEGAISELFTLEVDQITGIGVINKHIIYELPNKYQHTEGHSDTEFFTHAFFYDDETIIDSKIEIPELIALCQQYIYNPVKFENL